MRITIHNCRRAVVPCRFRIVPGSRFRFTTYSRRTRLAINNNRTCAVVNSMKLGARERNQLRGHPLPPRRPAAPTDMAGAAGARERQRCLPTAFRDCRAPHSLCGDCGRLGAGFPSRVPSPSRTPSRAAQQPQAVEVPSDTEMRHRIPTAGHVDARPATHRSHRGAPSAGPAWCLARPLRSVLKNYKPSHVE